MVRLAAVLALVTVCRLHINASWVGGRSTGSLRAPFDSKFCNIPRIPAAEFTQARYIEEFEGRSPFIITGGTAGWDAEGWNYGNFLNNDTLRKVRVTANSYGILDSDTTSLAAVVEHLFSPRDSEVRRSTKLRVDARAFLDPVLVSGFTPPLWASQREQDWDGPDARNFVQVWRREQVQYLRDISAIMAGNGLNLEDETPEDRYLVIGPSAGGDKPHVDVENVSFWNALIHGRKRWLFFLPAHLEIMRANKPAEVAEWSATHPYTQTSYAWHTYSYAKVSRGWTGSWWRGSDPSLRPFECFQQPGDVVYGPGGMMHTVLTVEDAIGITEQIVDQANFRGQINYQEFVGSGLLELGFCDSGVKDLRLQTVQQLRILSVKPNSMMLHEDEIADPRKRVVPKVQRAITVVSWLSYCAAVSKVRPNLFAEWEECQGLYERCGGFVSTVLNLRKGYTWYPEVKLIGSQASAKAGKRKTKRGRPDL
jgi:hypothetical protein